MRLTRSRKLLIGLCGCFVLVMLMATRLQGTSFDESEQPPCALLSEYVVLARIAGAGAAGGAVALTESQLRKSCTLRRLARVDITPSFSELDLHRYRKEGWLSDAVYHDIVTNKAQGDDRKLSFASMKRLVAHMEVWKRAAYDEQMYLVIEDGAQLDYEQFDKALPAFFDTSKYTCRVLYLGSCPSCSAEDVTRPMEEYPRMQRWFDASTTDLDEMFSSYAYFVSPLAARLLLDRIYPLQQVVEERMTQIVRENNMKYNFCVVSQPQLVFDPPQPEIDANANRILIPKIFHRVWVGGKPMPAEVKENGVKWKRLHPDWIVKDWDDAAVAELSLHNRDLYDTLNDPSKFSARSDILRFELLYQFGGIYVDTDFEPLQNMEPILQGVTGFAGWQEAASIASGMMGSVPGHPLLRKLVFGLRNNVRDHPFGNVVVTYGPTFAREMIFNNPDIPFRVFSNIIFYPYIWTEPRPETYSEYAYAVHHWAKSWF